MSIDTAHPLRLQAAHTHRRSIAGFRESACALPGVESHHNAVSPCRPADYHPRIDFVQRGRRYTQRAFHRHDTLLTRESGKKAPENLIVVPWDRGPRYRIVEAKRAPPGSRQGATRGAGPTVSTPKGRAPPASPPAWRVPAGVRIRLPTAGDLVDYDFIEREMNRMPGLKRPRP